MTNLVYRLNDGTRVKTMSEAKASGQPYKVEYEPIPDFNTSTTFSISSSPMIGFAIETLISAIFYHQ